MKQTITAISRKTGLSKSYLSELSSGKKNNPTYKTIKLLAGQFRIKPIWANVFKKLEKLSRSQASVNSSLTGQNNFKYNPSKKQKELV